MALPLIGAAFRVLSVLSRGAVRAGRAGDRLDLFEGGGGGGIGIRITTNIPAVIRQLDQLHADIARKALTSAINKTMAQAKTAMSREIRSEFNMPASKVNAALRITRASYHGGMFTLQATLESPSKRGRSLNLINFGARQTRKGVSFKVKHGSGGRKVIPGAFIANDGRTVFIRVGKSRLPIKALQTIGVAQMFNTKRVNARVVSTIKTKFPQIFAHEAQHYVDRFNALKASI